ncbi:MAG TPA: hypothetical protein VNZ43_02645 [Sphingomonadaceae bacterium]|nr:hypothetical protein [Sphingomonadaceae bacterium]
MRSTEPALTLRYMDSAMPTTASRRGGDRLASLLFVHLGLIGCICLQRFCVYFGGSPLFLCFPLFLALVGWMLATERAEFRPLSLGFYGAFAVVAVISALFAVNAPDPRIEGFSLASLLGILILYAGLTIRPTARFDGSQTFTIFIFYVRLTAVLGIIQYLAQFAGVRLFSFMLAVPSLRPILAEPLYNYHPVVAYGSSVLRSNGFFLLEPSIFSQLLALGMLVDFFIRREWRFLPLYGIAYLFTYAGTGLLALSIACVLYPLFDRRDIWRMLAFAALALALILIGALAFPDQFGALAGRTDELSATGSSAHARYMTQFDVIASVWGETRVLIGLGPGALERAHFFAMGGGNAALKLFVEYGVFGLLSFMTFFLASLWRRPIAIVSLFLFVNFQLGGGNLLFPPLVILAAILCIWSDGNDPTRSVPGRAAFVLRSERHR